MLFSALLFLLSSLPTISTHTLLWKLLRAREELTGCHACLPGPDFLSNSGPNLFLASLDCFILLGIRVFCHLSSWLAPRGLCLVEQAANGSLISQLIVMQAGVTDQCFSPKQFMASCSVLLSHITLFYACLYSARATRAHRPACARSPL